MLSRSIVRLSSNASKNHLNKLSYSISSTNNIENLKGLNNNKNLLNNNSLNINLQKYDISTIQQTYNNNNNYNENSYQYNKMIALGALTGIGVAAYLSQNDLIAEEEKSSFIQNIKKNTHQNYENRIREKSNPRKIFEFFAKTELPSGFGQQTEYALTPEGFVRAVIPATSYDNREDIGDHIEKYLGIFKKVDQDGDGLISFGEFIFFITLLSIPEKYIHVAFKMFDGDGNGTVDSDEFVEVMKYLRKSNSFARAERDSVFSDEVEEAGKFPLFFGEDNSKKLSSHQFTSFIRELKSTIRRIEFSLLSSYDENTDTVSARDFGAIVIRYGNLLNNSHFISKVEDLEKLDTRISYDQYEAFNTTLNHLDEIDFAMKMFVNSGKPFTKNELKRCAKSVANAVLNDDSLNIIFHIFDKDSDNLLDYDEFIGILSGRNTFGLSKPRDSGFTRFLGCCKKCFTKEF
eukprot:TRINITY_DN2862_c1_g1_i2.p2 TRINITY_DN2862_c1_g1~~TRINITY_DN2862_c1_g1_i2.p2  ORF type:complete len:461 (+),score=156.53 TRINITY_DN2862_c1_g1_i2:41-1423(+)